MIRTLRWTSEAIRDLMVQWESWEEPGKVQTSLGALYPRLALSKSQLSFPWLRYMSAEFSTRSLSVSAHCSERKVECSWVVDRWGWPLLSPRYLGEHMYIVVTPTLASRACCSKWRQQYHRYHYLLEQGGKKIQAIREFEHVSCIDYRGNKTLVHCLVIRTEFLGIAFCIPGLIKEFHRSRYSGKLLFNVLVTLFQVCSV